MVSKKGKNADVIYGWSLSQVNFDLCLVKSLATCTFSHVKYCPSTLRSQIEWYTRLLIFRKFSILPAVFPVINEKFCQPYPFIQASSSIRDLRVASCVLSGRKVKK